MRKATLFRLWGIGRWAEVRAEYGSRYSCGLFQEVEIARRGGMKLEVYQAAVTRGFLPLHSPFTAPRFRAWPGSPRGFGPRGGMIFPTRPYSNGRREERESPQRGSQLVPVRSIGRRGLFHMNWLRQARYLSLMLRILAVKSSTHAASFVLSDVPADPKIFMTNAHPNWQK